MPLAETLRVADEEEPHPFDFVNRGRQGTR